MGSNSIEAGSLVWVQCGKNLHWTTQIRAGDANYSELFWASWEWMDKLYFAYILVSEESV